MTTKALKNRGLSDKMAMAYAAGILPEAFDLVISAHICLNSEARACVESYEAIGGAILEDLEPETLSDHALESVMRKIEDDAPRPCAETKCNILPSPLRKYFAGGLEKVKWRALGNGVKQSIIETPGDARARLLYIPEGKSMPCHGHSGSELTLVLQGSYLDGGTQYKRGDLAEANQDDHHHPQVESGADCICLIATDARLRFHGFLPRVLQPILRI